MLPIALVPSDRVMQPHLGSLLCTDTRRRGFRLTANTKTRALEMRGTLLGSTRAVQFRAAAPITCFLDPEIGAGASLGWVTDQQSQQSEAAGEQDPHKGKECGT